MDHFKNNLCEKIFVHDVRLIVENLRNEILLLKRASESGFGLWNPPGGKIEWGISKRDTCKKEFFEETQLVVQIDDLKSYFTSEDLPNNDNLVHYFTYFYRISKYSGEVKINDESLDFSWVKKDDLVNYDIAFGFERGINRYFEKFSE